VSLVQNSRIKSNKPLLFYLAKRVVSALSEKLGEAYTIRMKIRNDRVIFKIQGINIGSLSLGDSSLKMIFILKLNKDFSIKRKLKIKEFQMNKLGAMKWYDLMNKLGQFFGTYEVIKIPAK